MSHREIDSLDELLAKREPNTPLREALRLWVEQSPADAAYAVAPQAIDVIEQAVRIWGSEEAALEWLQYPIPALNSERPCDLLSTAQGCDRIQGALGTIEHGDFT